MEDLAGNFRVRCCIVIDMEGIFRSIKVHVVIVIGGGFFLGNKTEICFLGKGKVEVIILNPPIGERLPFCLIAVSVLYGSIDKTWSVKPIVIMET